MKNIIFSLILIAIVLVSCNKDQKIDLFKINKQNIGLLTDSTQVKNLKIIYAKDSIVKFIKGDEFTGDVNDIDIYEIIMRSKPVLFCCSNRLNQFYISLY